MENKEIIPVTFRWEMWENHVNPTYFALYRNNMISYEELDKYMEESHYKDYLRQEIKDRIKRHEPILSLLDMSEKQNENCDTSVDYFSKGKWVQTCETPSELSRGMVSHDDYPFFRKFVLPDGGMIMIKDEHKNSKHHFVGVDSPLNNFSTEITLYKDERRPKIECLANGEVDSESVVCVVPEKENIIYEEPREPKYVEDVFVGYSVNAYNNPLSITIRYNNAYLYMSNYSLNVSYTNNKLSRELSFVKRSKTENIFHDVEYVERTGIDSAEDGQIQIMWHGERRETLFSAGYDPNKLFPMVMPEPWVSSYSHAIASHEKSKELINAVLEMIYERIPKLKKFLKDTFPYMMEFIDGEKLSIPEIDEVFNIVANPLLEVDKTGFIHADSEDLKELQEYYDFIRANKKRKRWEEKNQTKIAEKQWKKEMKKVYKEGQQRNSGD